MTDEEILNLWKKGWNIGKIVNSIVKLKNIKDDESKRKEYNRVEKIVFKFYQGKEGEWKLWNIKFLFMEIAVIITKEK